MNSIHQFTVKNIEGKEVSLSDYKGKVLLIINTASKCGFTPQLDNMEALYKEYEGKDFELLAFPSNDFGGQEPLEGEALEQFCRLDYKANYPIFDKIPVKGEKADPLYQFLSQKKLNGKLSSKPRWNFHKYLVDKEGRVVDYFLSLTKPDAKKVKKAIDKLLAS